MKPNSGSSYSGSVLIESMENGFRKTIWESRTSISKVI